MSLNFVSTSVLSSTDGLSHNTETPISNPSNSTPHNSLTHRSSSQTPLFEQLRKNQQEAQDNYDEVTKAMRGTRTLDDEDVAHLQSVENVREDRDREVRRRVETELEMYRAAKMEKGMTVTVDSEVGEEVAVPAGSGYFSVPVQAKEKNISLSSNWPKIVLTKKRRRKVTPQIPLISTKPYVNCSEIIAIADEPRKRLSSSTQTSSGKQENLSANNSNNKSNPATVAGSKVDTKGIFGGLLGDYGSDNDDSD